MLADIREDTYHANAAPVLYIDTLLGDLLRLESPTVLNGIGSNTCACATSWNPISGAESPRRRKYRILILNNQQNNL
jgi:hypothetical protein